MITPKNSNAAAATKPQQTQQQGLTPQNKILARMSSPEVLARINSLWLDKKTLDSFIAVVTGLVRTNPKIAECSEVSFMAAMLKCASLNFIPNDPIRQHCWLIPRRNKKTGGLELNWEAGYKGLIELAYRSDEVEAIACAEIRERDFFDVDWGTNHVSHKLPKENRFKRGEIEAYWAQWVGKDGAKGRPVIMTMDEMKEHAEQYVESLDSEYSPWNTAFNEMALKTVIKRCLKTAPLSSDDLRQGLDESLPADNPKHQPPMTNVTPIQYAADPMLVSPDSFKPQVVEAEYENVKPEQPAAEPAQKPEPQPHRAPAASSEENQRQEMLEKLEQKIKSSGLDQSELIVKLGMPPSMMKSASLTELVRMYRAIQ